MTEHDDPFVILTEVNIDFKLKSFGNCLLLIFAIFRTIFSASSYLPCVANQRGLSGHNLLQHIILWYTHTSFIQSTWIREAGAL